MGIIGWISLYLLVPLFIGIILMITYSSILTMYTGRYAPFIFIIFLVMAVGLFIWFVYLYIRLAFSYYILLYSENIGKAKTYVHESLRMTKKKVWKIILLSLPFVIIIGAITSSLEFAHTTILESRVYDKLIAIQKLS